MNYYPLLKSFTTIASIFYSVAILPSPHENKNSSNVFNDRNYQCHINATEPPKALNTNKIFNPVKDAIYLGADNGQIILQGISTLEGNVSIQQNDTVFNADKAKINRTNSQVTASGNVVLSNDNFELKSPLVTYNLNTSTGTIDNVEYSLGTKGIRGKSSRLEQTDKNKMKLKDATFTSCPINTNSWHLASSDIQLNQETQIGTAKNVTFNVGDVPVFYFPWLKFPINDQRLSGFLSPSVRLQSNAGITIPYYLNLAPNYDATISLSSLESRGVKLDTEFRYLSELHKGILNYNLIPNDNSFDDENRYYFSVEHITSINTSTRVNLNAEGVSDEEYFDDFSDSLETSSRSALQRRLEIINKNEPWSISAAVEDYQILDASDDTYSKLPEFIVNFSPKSGPKDFKFDVNSELIHFDIDDGVTGLRADIKSKISKKWGGDSWYFKPSFSLDHTYYSLDNTIGDKHISRSLPTLSFDTGLFFDREITNKKGDAGLFTQTLEPRIFYTYTPFKDQSDIPIFDTALNNFTESNQLFLENRFTGKDRISDTNQITFAVSSRLQDRKNGNELLKATLGQVFYFSDRKVTLDGGTILSNRNSDLLLELSGRLNENFRLASTINIDSDEKKVSSYDLRLNYQDDKKRIANLSFRELDTELRQISFSAAMPINDKWSMVASSDHDTKNDRNLESLIGVEYQDCCWKTRLVVKRYLTSDNETYENPVFLEFELKGLGNIGKSATRQIKEDIYGYDGF